jgi:N-dimethylarginine dimethylaminohydrolase
MRLNIDSETKTLKSIIVGISENLNKNGDVEIINETMKKNYNGSKNIPTAEKANPEFKNFVSFLKNKGIEIYKPTPIDGIPEQMFPRDIGFVIGDKFFIANMKYESRKKEFRGIKGIIEDLGYNTIKIPKGIIIEGGDILVDKGNVYVGIGQRSDQRSIDFLKDALENKYNIVPCYTQEIKNGEDVLHLDCTVNPIGKEHLIIYKEGLKKIPDAMRETYRFIEVGKNLQQELFTNILSISEEEAIARKGFEDSYEIISKMADVKFNYIKFDEAPKNGGSFRCSTLPLIRGD